MRNIHCEYCGGLIDVETDDMCPSCGASFDKNKYLFEKRKVEKEKEALEQRKNALEVEERKERLKRQKIENQNYQTRMKNMERTQKTTKRVVLLLLSPFIAFAIMFVILFIGGMIVGVTEAITENAGVEDTVDTRPLYEYRDVTAGFDEFANNGVWEVKVDKFETFDPYPFDDKQGYVSVAIHFIVKNTAEETLEDNSKVVVLADELLVEKRGGYYDQYKELKVTDIPADTKYDGYLLYKVPVDAETITIKYGDYITFEFDNPINN